jgi:hypothetical protein
MQHRKSPVPAPFLVQTERTGDEEDENEAQALSISDQRTLYLVRFSSLLNFLLGNYFQLYPWKISNCLMKPLLFPQPK